MKAKELRALSVEELDTKIKEARQEWRTLNLKHKSGMEIEKPARLKTMRHDIARMLTVRTEKDREAKK